MEEDEEEVGDVVVVVMLVSWLMAMSRCGVWQWQCVASGGC